MPVALRRISIVGLVFAFACGPTQRRSAGAVEGSSGASAHSQESPCTADRAECGPALGWADCDDCDTDELATRGGRAALVDCLGEALRCGPDAARQERYELHGRREEWSVRHRARAVRGLASLAPEGTEMLEQSRAWTLPESVADAIDLELGGP